MLEAQGAEVVATYSDINLTGQNAPHVISGAGTGIFSYQIDLSQQQSGVYFLTLKTAKGAYINKIVRTE